MGRPRAEPIGEGPPSPRLVVAVLTPPRSPAEASPGTSAVRLGRAGASCAPRGSAAGPLQGTHESRPMVSALDLVAPMWPRLPWKRASAPRGPGKRRRVWRERACRFFYLKCTPAPGVLLPFAQLRAVRSIYEARAHFC